MAAMALASCASTGGLHTQSTMESANGLAVSASLQGATVSPAAWPKQAWWESFGDAQLNQLVQAALAEQPSLRAAAARVEARPQAKRPRRNGRNGGECPAGQARAISRLVAPVASHHPATSSCPA